MGLIDWIRNMTDWFKKIFKKSEVPQEHIDRIVQIADSDKKEIPEEAKQEQQKAAEVAAPEPEPETKIVVPSNNPDGPAYLQIDLEKLELDKIEKEAETIAAYSKILIKDTASYRDNKTDVKLKSVTAKYKMIFMHGMELKNLVSLVNEQFHEYVLKNFKIDDAVRKELEGSQQKIYAVTEVLTKFGLYDELFNPEKAQNFKSNIDSEIEKGFAKEVENLGKLLSEDILNKQSSIITETRKIAGKLKR
jgi:hypothetical protein